MNKFKTVLAAGAALAVTAGVAVAQTPAQPAPAAAERPQRGAPVTRDQALARADAMFARLDTNGDGTATRDEARAARQARMAERLTARFDRLDANRDGQLSREEFGQRPAMQADRGERRGWRGHGRRGGRHMAMGGRMFGEDGVVTRDEFRQAAATRFDRVDANRDGTITVDERRGARRHMRDRVAPPAPTQN